MRLANLEETKPEAAAVKLVQKQMAELYKLVSGREPPFGIKA